MIVPVQQPAAPRDSGSVTYCRYLRKSGDQCTGEAVDPAADILLCSKHGARWMRVVAAQAEATGLTKMLRRGA